MLKGFRSIFEKKEQSGEQSSDIEKRHFGILTLTVSVQPRSSTLNTTHNLSSLSPFLTPLKPSTVRFQFNPSGEAPGSGAGVAETRSKLKAQVRVGRVCCQLLCSGYSAAHSTYCCLSVPKPKDHDSTRGCSLLVHGAVGEGAALYCVASAVDITYMPDCFLTLYCLVSLPCCRVAVAIARHGRRLSVCLCRRSGKEKRRRRRERASLGVATPFLQAHLHDSTSTAVDYCTEGLD